MTNEFRQLRLSQLDRNVSALRDLPPPPKLGWLASIREALGLPLEEMGQRLHVSRQAIKQIEQAEADDRITLGALRRLAGAMGCDVRYALVPKVGSFVELAESPIRDRAKRDVENVMHTMLLEGQKPESADQLLKDEAQRRLNRRKLR